MVGSRRRSKKSESELACKKEKFFLKKQKEHGIVNT